MTLPTRKHALQLAVLTALVLGANLYVFFTRDWESSHRGTSYAELYYPLDVPTLRGWTVEEPGVLRLDLAWDRRPAEWQMLLDGQVVRTMPGAQPKLFLAGPVFDGDNGQTLENSKRRYTLRALPAGTGPDLHFDVTAISKRFYGNRGMTFVNDIHLVGTDVPVGRFERQPVSAWVDDYSYVGAEGLAAADRIVREEIGVKDTDDSLTRIAKVTRYVRTALAGAGGVPKNDFRWMNPWLMCREMIAGTGKGWCTQNAQIYVFFANRAGVPTRFVFASTTQDNTIVYNGHSWAESWVKEQGRWSYVDVTRALFGVADRHGVLLNTADIVDLVEHDAFEGVTARIYKDWNWPDLPVEAKPLTPVVVPFNLVNAVAKSEYGRQTIIKYRRPPNVEDLRGSYGMLLRDRTFAYANLKRYLWEPAPAYSKYPTNGSATYNVRQGLFAALMLSVGLLGVALVRKPKAQP